MPASTRSTTPHTRSTGTGTTATQGSADVDARIRALPGWQAATLSAIRKLIHAADPDIEEACKWAKANNPLGVPVWSHGGIVCTGEAYKAVVKLTFARGAALPDPKKLFNASLEGNARRAIDLREGEMPPAAAFKALVKAAVAANLAGGKPAR